MGAWSEHAQGWTNYLFFICRHIPQVMCSKHSCKLWLIYDYSFPGGVSVMWGISYSGEKVCLDSRWSHKVSNFQQPQVGNTKWLCLRNLLLRLYEWTFKFLCFKNMKGSLNDAWKMLLLFLCKYKPMNPYSFDSKVFWFNAGKDFVVFSLALFYGHSETATS